MRYPHKNTDSDYLIIYPLIPAIFAFITAIITEVMYIDDVFVYIGLTIGK